MKFWNIRTKIICCNFSTKVILFILKRKKIHYFNIFWLVFLYIKVYKWSNCIFLLSKFSTLLIFNISLIETWTKFLKSDFNRMIWITRIKINDKTYQVGKKQVKDTSVKKDLNWFLWFLQFFILEVPSSSFYVRYPGVIKPR